MISGDQSSTFRSVVICGPSGVGKGTVISYLINMYPTKFGLSVSHTTRSPRFIELINSIIFQVHLILHLFIKPELVKWMANTITL